ncbi:16S rRNA (adenine(1518)-N(6)/adenine(1519)-N(6))-dimethyltransferase RsmA [Fluviicola sp.]|jgi:16S rRNA (adenine1518-N6/adenine1519-N6)-dimethyltransferase|uniref:16S rRNA (adenine(1518)-N(6)/adenine(1519)-N(6))- dimethyltransferase RsmA n=1 Tax=Fluviicola sp. TaxID=1917219 RepID=UPI00282F86FA|nr:16S rRNA (adenine(1518)-N(6)/adenine(1519)-N(6))-dimethyltransferase RsmA [Fluviicola sp.]MDR0801948.1 16S rRNA (adenine(1518)-N(6)/adenine(1519)-N(6))-dimethyltransferase RsmA [Fluviicola sp.]
MSVRAKKHLGQHFLKDKNICKKIADQFGHHQGVKTAIEIGPGMGALTEYLLQDSVTELYVMDVDPESIDYLKAHYPQLGDHIIFGDFLKMDPTGIVGSKPFAVLGNFPYNISSQILFKCIDFKDSIPEIMGMFQKEVAERVAEKPGSKTYGILSVLLQAYYDIEYCFTVDEHVFDPPPKVKSGVIRCTRNNREKLPCDEKLFKQIVKMAFNQRRKTIRNSIKALLPESYEENPTLQLRPERLGVEEFIELTNWVERNRSEG